MQRIGADLGGSFGGVLVVAVARDRIGERARRLDPAHRGRWIFRGQRELAEIEREARIVDHRRRQLGEHVARARGLVARQVRFGAEHHGVDQVALVVDQLADAVERRERRIRIADVVQLEPRDRDARRRVVRVKLDQRVVLRERLFGLAARIGDAGGERDQARVLAVDPLAPLHDRRGLVERTLFEEREAALEIRLQTVGPGHARTIQRERGLHLRLALATVNA